MIALLAEVALPWQRSILRRYPKAGARLLRDWRIPRLCAFNFAETLERLARPAIPFLLKALRGHENGGSSCCCQDRDPD